MLTFFPFQLRSTPKPTIQLPIACRSVGYFSTSPGWHNPSTLKPFVQLFWGIKGTGVFVLEGKSLLLKPHEVFVLFSGQRHHITAQDNWQYRWMTLDGEMPDEVVKSFGIGGPPFKAGACPEELFERLASEIAKISPQSQRVASSTAYEILSLANFRRPDTPRATKRLEKCIELIRCHYASTDFNISLLAREVGMHRTSLSQLFRSNMMMSRSSISPASGSADR